MSLQDLFNRDVAKATPTTITPPVGAYGSYRLNKIRLDVRTASDKVAKKEGQRDLLLKQRDDAEKRQRAATDQLDTLDKVQVLLQKASDFARQQVKGRIEEIVSQALNVVYGDGHRFIIDLQVRSNRPEADYWLKEGDVLTKLEKPDYNNGGGKIDVVTLALRLAIAELEGAPGPIFLDEVGKHVDGEAVVNVAYFLKQYSENFDRQLPLITHNADLAEIGDISLNVTRKNGVASVKRL